MAACPALSSGEVFVSSLMRHIDCQAQAIGTIGYQTLAAPGSAVSLAITGLLTIFVALFGLRMMLGETPSLRGGVIAIVKIGVVLTIATSWPAFRTVIYDVVVDGPAELTSLLATATGLPGGGGDFITRLQNTDAAMNRLITLGSGRNDLSSTPPAGPDGLALTEPRGPIADDPAFGWARVLFLSSAVTAHAIIRLLAGVLLALAPLFAGLLLFDIAVGVFVGWLRALVFTILASIATTLLIGVELTMLDPWLAQLLQLREAKIMTAAAPLELLVVCLAFAVALLGAMSVLLRLAFTIDLSFRLQTNTVRGGEARPGFAFPDGERLALVTAQARDSAGNVASPSRAMALASSLQAAQRREAGVNPGARSTMAGASPGRAAQAPSGAMDSFAIPTPTLATRRTRRRQSLGAVLRDNR